MNKLVFYLFFANYICKSYNYTLFTLPDEFIINNTPIVGVLSQEISYHLSGHYPDANSYIAASYVKFVEGAGARVVPIWIGQPKEYYEDIMSHINGVLFPGGATWFNTTNGYSDAGRYIFDIAKEMNNNGQFMPLWGTCLGFELLTYLDADSREHRAYCSSNNQPLPLNFKPDIRNSRLFNNTPSDIIKILATEAVTTNNHQYCVTEKNLTDFGIAENWRIMSTSDDWNGFTFISTMEHTRYPFYGVQFHPEKNIYEWIPKRNISHTANSIRASQWFAEFFVNEARKSLNTFDSVVDLESHLIYNYQTTYTGLKKSVYQQCYLFGDNVQHKFKTNAVSDNNNNQIVDMEIG